MNALAHGAAEAVHAAHPLDAAGPPQFTGSADITQLAGSAVQSVDWLAISPPTIAAVAGLAVLVADLFLPERGKRLLGPAAAVSLLLAALPLLFLRSRNLETFCLPDGSRACAYSADTLSLVLQFLVLGAAFVTALLSMPAVRDLRLPAGEYWFLLLSATAGAALVPASRDLVTLVIALETASLPAFALVGLRRGSRGSAEAALKFFLSSVTATAVTLLGASFLYAVTGTLYFRGISEGLSRADPQLEALGSAGIALTLVGFAFKAAVVPFHFWVPDTYVGAPVPVAAFLSVVGKTAGISGLILLLVQAFSSRAELWGTALAVLAAVTMTAGNAAALRQSADRAHGAVRLLAWSSVGQAGYLLVPLAAAAPDVGGEEPSGTALSTVGATVAYLLMYAAVNLGAFAVVAHISRTSRANRLADYRGLYAAHPVAALALAFFLLCLAGLPPGVIGLFAKLAIFSTAIGNGLGWLAVIMAVNVVIALFYYLRWTALAFRAPTADAAVTQAGEGHQRTRMAPPLAAGIALTAAAGVALSLDPDLVLTFTAGGLR
ncbi:NADH-quinone oxidoreductase subunit N [Streptomyces sp. WMMB 322]|uniref:NADH-quinone oxidoreductase subunit N n=1 Tax=Streptomyces sp. WMMB 322 TaxID=1286821 RepID=UPI000823A841|nr:NADH-quinone oxidoreductase subunit N [Streptomyces sp. WMMB 322]SCK29513.1 NADH dehydrogenase subunit N [Streptomyces sp. WMMB 322]